ncbi:MAG: hypothetical protein JKY37_23775 [Nannocystaceae bacterium]|nr:hypothetical protein [Nannocystaceae bacterium]
MARRSLAASVVITISLAELACSSGPSHTRNPPPQPSGNESPPKESPPKESPPKDDLSGESEGAVEINTPVKTQTTIQKLEDGTCMEYVSVSCPAGVMCNPPPPNPVPCPEDKPSGA